jgi:hypothetical protein
MYVCMYVMNECMDGCIYIYICTCRIAVDVRQEVYCTAVRTGGREEWEFILQRFHAAVHKPSESDVLLASLVCTHKEWLLLT